MYSPCDSRATDPRASRPVRSLVPAVLLLVLLPGTAIAMEGKLGLGLVRLDPIGQDSKSFSGPGWGLGLQLTSLLPRTPRVLAGVAGFDVVLGMDVNPWNTVSFDTGARIAKTFNVPQQLESGTRRIHPGYIQGYFAVAVSLDWLGRLAGD